MKKIKPIISYYGSKFRMLDKIFELLDLKENDKFLDMFGGTGIVGINAKHIFNCHEVIINDYDRILPVNLTYALKNILSFEGNGKNYTLDRLKFFIRRLDNGWENKFWTYNYNLEKCIIWSNDFRKYDKHFLTVRNSINKIYVDPPYFNKKGMYKNSFNNQDHIDLFNQLETLKSDIKILVSYNDCDYIRNLYKDWKIIEIDKTNTAGGNKKGVKTKELIITC